MHHCPRCQSDRLIKHGSATDKPKKLCKACGYQFTRMTPRGKPFTTQVNAVLWYLSGVSMNRIAFLSRVSVQAVLNWIRAFAKASYAKPAPAGKIIVLQLDEMWHYVQKKRQRLWMWKALDRESGRLLDWECGRRDKKTLQKMVDRLAQWDVKLYCTDKWASYASVIPKEKLVQSKATTHTLERNHCRQRHWFGRFKRKSILRSHLRPYPQSTAATRKWPTL